MNTSVLTTKIVPSLLRGTGREPIDGVPGPDRELRALSLAGQALRFEVPAPPPHFAVEAVVADARCMLPDALRRPLLRLVTGKLATEHAPLALAHAFDRLRLRPHPFDLPRMDSFIRMYAEQLGTTAQHWARPAEEAIDAPGYFDEELLTDANWTLAPAARQAIHLDARRSQDHAAGRALLEAAWPKLSADIRVRLLRTFAGTVGADDREFLESLDKDRAPRVRSLAQRLLARLGGGAENPSLSDLLPRIRQTQSGFLRKRPALALELPATVKEQAAPMWLREAFADIGFDELAKALSLSEEDVVEAAAKDANLQLALALVATGDRRLDLLEKIVEHLPQAWEQLEQTGLRELTPLSPEERLRWAAILIQPYGRRPPTAYLQWSWMHRLLRQPAPPALFDAILAGSWLEALPDIEKQGTHWMELLVALCPPTLRARLRDRLFTLDSTTTSTAIPLLDMLDAMENRTRHA